MHSTTISNKILIFCFISLSYTLFHISWSTNPFHPHFSLLSHPHLWQEKHLPQRANSGGGRHREVPKDGQTWRQKLNNYVHISWHNTWLSSSCEKWNDRYMTMKYWTCQGAKPQLLVSSRKPGASFFVFMLYRPALAIVLVDSKVCPQIVKRINSCTCFWYRQPLSMVDSAKENREHRGCWYKLTANLLNEKSDHIEIKDKRGCWYKLTAILLDKKSNHNEIKGHKKVKTCL